MSNRPEVLLLSLAHDDYFDNHYYRLINNLCIASSLNRVKTLNGAIRYLSSNTPKAILITDGGLADLENSAALEKVKSYVQTGGIAIFGMQFPRIEEPELAHYMFNEVLGLDWWFGDYCSVSVEFNPLCSLPLEVVRNSFPGLYHGKFHHIIGAKPHERIMEPRDSERYPLDSYEIGSSQVVTVGAKLGDGYVAYFGNVNPDVNCERVIFALCGLSG